MVSRIMIAYLVALTIAVASIVSPGIADVFSDEEHEVVDLTTNMFDAFMVEHEYVLVEFYAPWCGHCKAFAPVYEEIAVQSHADGTAKIARVDATKESALASRFGIRGFPTVKLFVNGKLHADYEGVREKDAVLDWIQTIKQPALHLLDADGALELLGKSLACLGAPAESATAITALVGIATSTDGSLLAQAAESARLQFARDMPVLAVADAAQLTKIQKKVIGTRTQMGDLPDKTVAKAKIDAGSTVLAILPDCRVRAETLPKDEDGRKAFFSALRTEALPLLAQLDAGSNFQVLSGAGVPFAIIFVDDGAVDDGAPTLSEDQTAALTKLAKPIRDKLRLSYVSGIKFKAFMDRLIPSSGNVALPTAVIFVANTSGQVMYFPHVYYESIGEDVPDFGKDISNLGGFFDAFIAGKVPWVPKSEDESAAADRWSGSKVVPLTGKSFEDIVYNESKDVFVEIFSATCPHCKNLEPSWRELADVFEDTDSVVIASLEATANDVPTDLQALIPGFPTLLLFPSGTDKGPTSAIPYGDPNRTVEGLTAFLERQASSTSSAAATGTNGEPPVQPDDIAGHDDL